MAHRAINKLSVAAVGRLRKKGVYSDGGNLFLQVSATGTKSWVFIYRQRGEGTQRWVGIGPLITVSIAEARKRAQVMRMMLLDGIDPRRAKQTEKARRASESVNTITFAAAAEKYVKLHSPAWKNAKHVEQWENTLETYASAEFGRLAVRDVTVQHVLRVLEPIWVEKHETAMRLRGRIESVLDWAAGKGYREGANPARWKGNLQAHLPNISRKKRIKHFAAMSVDDLSAFMAELRARDGAAARCLEFTVLTSVRSGEARGARWGEIDLEARLWTIPKERTKTQSEHLVPLGARACEILNGMAHREGLVFAGRKKGAELSDATLLKVLRTLRSEGDLTVHGFRSTFKDWASERTNFAREVSEMALGHAISNAVEAAYRRGALLVKRRALATQWEAFCASAPKAKVVSLPSKPARELAVAAAA